MAATSNFGERQVMVDFFLIILILYHVQYV
jgi:hypothetical protein